MRRIRIPLVIVLALLALVPVAALVTGLSSRHTPSPAWFGVGSDGRHRVGEEKIGTSYRFAVLGDIQQGHAAFRAALDRIREEGDVAFAVVCGDLVNRKSLPHYRVLFSAIEDSDPGVPVLTVPGNHDDSGLYEEHLGPRFWWKFAGPDLLISVDTSEVDSPAPMLQKLAAVLAIPHPQARYRFVFLHRPTARPGNLKVKFAALSRLLAEGEVDAVFAGHLHHFETFMLDGVRYVTNGRGGDLTGGLTSEASLALVDVTPEGLSVAEVKLGRRSEIRSLIRSGLVTRVYESLGPWGTVLAAVLLIVAAGAATRIR